MASWHQDISSRSFKSCKLRGQASMDYNAQVWYQVIYTFFKVLLPYTVKKIHKMYDKNTAAVVYPKKYGSNILGFTDLT